MLASADNLIGGFNLIQERFYFSEHFQAGTTQVSWILSYDASGRGKFVRKLAGKKCVVRAGFRDDLLIWLRCVQSSEPALKRQTPSKAVLIDPRYRLGQRDIEMCYDLEGLLSPG